MSLPSGCRLPRPLLSSARRIGLPESSSTCTPCRPRQPTAPSDRALRLKRFFWPCTAGCAIWRFHAGLYLHWKSQPRKRVGGGEDEAEEDIAPPPQISNEDRVCQTILEVWEPAAKKSKAGVRELLKNKRHTGFPPWPGWDYPLAVWEARGPGPHPAAWGVGGPTSPEESQEGWQGQQQSPKASDRIGVPVRSSTRRCLWRCIPIRATLSARPSGCPWQRSRIESLRLGASRNFVTCGVRNGDGWLLSFGAAQPWGGAFRNLVPCGVKSGAGFLFVQVALRWRFKKACDMWR